jgi:hypothetical protein
MRLHIDTMLKASKKYSWPITANIDLFTGKVKLYCFKNNHYTYITVRKDKDGAKELLSKYDLVINKIDYSITLLDNI